MPPKAKIKDSLNGEEVLEVVSKLEDIEALLKHIDVSVLVENEALEESVADVIIYARVRLIQCLKLLGARYVPLKQMVVSNKKKERWQ